MFDKNLNTVYREASEAYIEIKVLLTIISRDFSMNKYVSFWRLFLTTKDIKKAEQLLKIFINENGKISLNNEIDYSVYHKDNTIKAQFYCEHVFETWEECVFNLMLTAQQSARHLILNDFLEEEVDIFTTDIFGAKGGVKALNITLSQEHYQKGIEV